jgi:hypothetical protein
VIAQWGAAVRRLAETTSAESRGLIAEGILVKLPQPDYLRLVAKIRRRLCAVEHHADRLGHDARNLAAVLLLDGERPDR